MPGHFDRCRGPAWPSNRLLPGLTNFSVNVSPKAATSSVKAYKEMFDQTVLLSLYLRHYNRSIWRVSGLDEHLKGPINKAEVG